MDERTTVRLPADLVKRAKRKASSEGRSLHALIEEGLRLVLAQKNGAPAPRRASAADPAAASGTLLPEVDLTATKPLKRPRQGRSA